MKELPLSNHWKPALVDDDVYERAKHFTWYLDSTGYPRNDRVINRKKVRVRLHNLVLGPSSIKEQIDHIRGKLDNRRESLRMGTARLNRLNNSKAKNVYKTSAGWRALISYEDKTIECGYFKTEAEARAVIHLLRGALIYWEMTK